MCWACWGHEVSTRLVCGHHRAVLAAAAIRLLPLLPCQGVAWLLLPYACCHCCPVKASGVCCRVPCCRCWQYLLLCRCWQYLLLCRSCAAASSEREGLDANCTRAPTRAFLNTVCILCPTVCFAGVRSLCPYICVCVYDGSRCGKERDWIKRAEPDGSFTAAYCRNLWCGSAAPFPIPPPCQRLHLSTIAQLCMPIMTVLSCRCAQVDQMVDTMRAHGAQGISAPQVLVVLRTQ